MFLCLEKKIETVSVFNGVEKWRRKGEGAPGAEALPLHTETSSYTTVECAIALIV